MRPHNTPQKTYSCAFTTSKVTQRIREKLCCGAGEYISQNRAGRALGMNKSFLCVSE